MSDSSNKLFIDNVDIVDIISQQTSSAVDNATNDLVQSMSSDGSTITIKKKGGTTDTIKVDSLTAINTGTKNVGPAADSTLSYTYRNSAGQISGGGKVPIPYFTVDQYGRVTNAVTRNITFQALNNYYNYYNYGNYSDSD